MKTIQPEIPLKQGHVDRRNTKRAEGNLLPGPPIAGYQIQRNEGDHFLIIDQRTVLCTRDEYHLLLRLLECYERPVSFDELLAQFYDHVPFTDPALIKTARRKLTYTLSVLRSKLLATDFTIVRVVDMGYLLTLQDNLWSLAHPSAEAAEERF